MVGRIANALWVLLAAAGLVLLVACANVANLFLVRSETRQREVAVRRALGAGGRSIARYFFSESVLLAAVGGALGLALAWGGVRLLVAFGPANLPRLNEVRIDSVVLAVLARAQPRVGRGVRTSFRSCASRQWRQRCRSTGAARPRRGAVIARANSSWADKWPWH